MTTLSKETHDRLGLDHGTLNGKNDDDHAQYLLVNGTRAMTGDLNIGTHALKTTNLLLKEENSEMFTIRNLADDAYMGLRANILNAYTRVSTDEITERTNDHGVDVDGCLIKDGIVEHADEIKSNNLLFREVSANPEYFEIVDRVTPTTRKSLLLDMALAYDAFETNTIRERSLGSGVNIDGCLIKDGFAKSRIADISDIPGTIAAVLTDHDKAAHDALTLDHGTLSGKGDDDHVQYLLVNGTRAMTGNFLPDSDIARDNGSESLRWNYLHAKYGRLNNIKVGVVEPFTGVYFLMNDLKVGSTSLSCVWDDSYLALQGGDTNPGTIEIYGEDEPAYPGQIRFYATDATKASQVLAMLIEGVTNTPKLQVEYGIKVDSITEKTGAAGVTIDGCLVKDSYPHIPNHTPSSASDTGTAGQICYNASYIHVCIATNTWKRIDISTW